MESNKKGASAANTYSTKGKHLRNNQVNYSRLTRVCPSLLMVSVVAFLIAYYLKNVNMTYLWAGAIGALGIIEVLLNPITEEDEEDGNA